MSKKNTRKTCSRCEKEQVLSNYYNTADKHIFADGKMPLCKNCCGAVYEEHGFEGFQDVMRLINKPIFDDLFKGDYSDYIRIVNSMPQYRVNNYNDSTMFEESKSLSTFKRAKPTELTEQEMKEAEDLWGAGKEEMHYIWLNNELDGYLNRYTVDSKALEDIIIDICLTRLDIRLRREAGNDVDKQIKTLNDLMTSANIKPSQETGNQSSDQETFATLIKKYENERPIPQPDDAWKDVDNVGKYIRTFFLGHIAKLFGKENPFQDEYEEVIGEHTVTPPGKDDRS